MELTQHYIKFSPYNIILHAQFENSF